MERAIIGSAKLSCRARHARSRCGGSADGAGCRHLALLLDASTRRGQTRLWWVSAHCGFPGNEKTDELAKEVFSLPHEKVYVDFRSLMKAVGLAASKAWQDSWPEALSGTS